MAVENGVITKDGVIRVLGACLSGEKGKTMRGKIESMKNSAMEAVDEGSGSSAQDFRTLIKLVTT